MPVKKIVLEFAETMEAALYEELDYYDLVHPAMLTSWEEMPEDAQKAIALFKGACCVIVHQCVPHVDGMPIEDLAKD